MRNPILWIGGPPDSGKSSAAKTLAERMNAAFYQIDRHEIDHLRKADRDTFPLHAKLFDMHVGPNANLRNAWQEWVDLSPAELATRAEAVWKERFPLIHEDVLALTRDQPVIVEGPAVFPSVVIPHLTGQDFAIWMIGDEAFKREAHLRRDKSQWRDQTSDPAQALANHIERDLILAESYRTELRLFNRSWIDVDGIRSPDELADEIEAMWQSSWRC